MGIFLPEIKLDCLIVWGLRSVTAGDVSGDLCSRIKRRCSCVECSPGGGARQIAESGPTFE